MRKMRRMPSSNLRSRYRSRNGVTPEPTMPQQLTQAQSDDWPTSSCYRPQPCQPVCPPKCKPQCQPQCKPQCCPEPCCSDMSCMCVGEDMMMCMEDCTIENMNIYECDTCTPTTFTN